MSDKTDSTKSTQGTKDNGNDKKFSLDMNTVFFGIVAIAFLFMAVGTFFPAHGKYLDKSFKGKVIYSSTVSGTLTFTDFECKQSDKVQVVYIKDDRVMSQGEASYQGAWSYTLPVVSLNEGLVLAHCENANGKEVEENVSS